MRTNKMRLPMALAAAVVIIALIVLARYQPARAERLAEPSAANGGTLRMVDGGVSCGAASQYWAAAATKPSQRTAALRAANSALDATLLFVFELGVNTPAVYRSRA